MAKKITVILLTIVLFLSAATLGVATVFRVSTVTVEASMVSSVAQTEAKEIRARLEKAYEKESTLFLDDLAAKEIVKDFPYFRITSFEKAFPNRIVVKISEDAEVYAVPYSSGVEEKDGYYLLNAQGEILGWREDYANRFDKEKNLLIKGFEVTPLEGKTLGGDDCYFSALALLQKADGLLDGIRRNITEAELMQRTPQTILRLQTREGVELCIVNPQTQTEEKAERVVNAYLSLSDEKRLTGSLVVLDGVNGVVADYNPEKMF